MQCDLSTVDLQNFVGEPFDEIAVVRDEQQGALKFFQRLFQRLACKQVEVVGRLVQHEEVCLFRFQKDERKLGALAARKALHLFVDVLVAELCACKQGARLRLAEPRMLVPQRAEHRLFGVEVGVFLVVVPDLVEPSPAHGGVSAAHEFADEGGFPRAVFAHDGDLFAPTYLKFRVGKQLFSACGKGKPAHGEGAFLALLRRFKTKDGRARGRQGLFEKFHRFQFFHARLRALCGGRPHDVARHIIFERGDLLLLFFVFAAIVLVLFRFEHFVFGIVSAEGGHAAVFQFEDLRDDAVEEVAVVRYGENGAAVVLEVLFQPEEGSHVQVVGRLVQEEDLGLFQKQAAQFQPRLFAAAHGGDLLPVHLRKAHSVEDGLDFYVRIVPVRGGNGAFQLFVAGGELFKFRSAVGDGGEALFNVAQRLHGAEHARKYRLHFFVHSLVAFQSAVLFENADFQPALFIDLSLVGGERARQKLYEGGFPLAVGADQPHALLFRDHERDVVEYDFVVVAEAYVFRGYQHNFCPNPHTCGMKNSMEKLSELEHRLAAASPAEVAPLVRKIVKLRRALASRQH